MAGDINHDFDATTGVTPFVGSTVQGTAGATEAGPTGNYYRLTTAANTQHIFMAFDRVQTAGAGTITADFDFRIANGSTPKPADGFGFAIVDCAQYGTTGGVTWGAAETPSLARGLGLGINVYNGGAGGSSDGTCSLYWNGQQVGATVDLGATFNYFPRKSGVTLASEPFDHCKVEVDLINKTVTVTIDPAGAAPSFQPFVNVSIPTLTPFVHRAAFGARCGGLNIHTAIDNVVFASTTVPEATSPTFDLVTDTADGIFGPSLQVALTQTEPAGPGVETRYTTNGSAPTATNGTVYTGPFTITATTTVRAATFAPGKSGSPIVQRIYTQGVPATTLTGLAAGVYAKYYEIGTFNRLPTYDQLVPESQFAHTDINVDILAGATAVPPPAYGDTFGLSYVTYLDVPKDAIYAFTLASDDGARLVIDGTQILGANGTANATLAKGLHLVRVDYFEITGGNTLSLSWAFEGQAVQVIPASRYFRQNFVATPNITIDANPANQNANFATTATVTIASTTPNARILVTTDGSFPTPNNHSFVYSAPFVVTDTTTIRAIALKDNLFDSGLRSVQANRTAENPLRLTSALAVNATTVDASFDRPVSLTGANFSISGIVGTITPTLDANTRLVHLALPSSLDPVLTYTLTVTGIQSATGTPIGSNNTATFTLRPRGVYFERFDGINGTLVSDLQAAAIFTGNTPTLTRILPQFNFTTLGDNYGTRMRAHLIVPQTGNYRFQLRSDDQGKLFVATDNNPANKVDTLTSNVSTVQSGDIALTAGTQVYLEVLQKEGGGGDDASLSWATPSSAGAFSLIPQSQLIAFDPGTITPLPTTGGMLRLRYTGFGGGTINDLINNAKYPNAPDLIDIVPTFESGPNIADNYGLRMTGYYTPTADAIVNFYVTGDDDVELWMSSDDDPAKLVRICFKAGGAPNGQRDWLVTATQKSADIAVKANQRYYMMGLQKEGGGGDGIAVTVLPVGTNPVNGTTPPIDGAFLTPDTLPVAGTVAQSKRFKLGTNQVLTATMSGGVPPYSIQWFKNGTPIANATSFKLALNNVGAADTASYTYSYSAGGGTSASGFVSAPINVQIYADISFVASTLNPTYDGTAKAVTAVPQVGTLTHTVTYNGSATAPTNAGDYNVTATITTAGIQGSVSDVLTIAKANGTVTPNANATVTYNGLPQTIGFTTAPAGLNVNVTYNGAATAVNANTYTVAYTINDPNSNVGTGTATLVIDKKSLTATADAKSREYGRANPATTISYSGFVGSEGTGDLDTVPTATIAASATDTANAGTTHAITVSGGLDNNYAYAPVSGLLTITQVTNASIAVAPTTTVVYDSNAQLPTITVDPPGLARTISITQNSNPATEAREPGVYTFTVTVNDPTNSTTSPSSGGQLTITKRPITVTADNKTRIYGNTTLPPTTLTYEANFVNGDDFNDIDTLPTATHAGGANNGTAPAGSTFPISVNGGTDTRYAIVPQAGTLTVLKRPLDLQVDSIQLEYGQPTPTTLPFTVVPASLAPGEDEADAIVSGAPAITTPRTLTSPAGTYPLNFGIGTLVFTNNYELGTSAGGTLTIVPTTTASLTVQSTTQAYTGSQAANPPVTTTPAGLSVVYAFTQNGQPATPLLPGVYNVRATIQDPDATVSPFADGTVTINKLAATITIGSLVQGADGTPKQVSVLTNPAALAVNVTYNGSTTAPSANGNYAVVVTINDIIYQGTAQATLRITAPAPIVSSALSANPNPATVGATVTFSVGASSPGGLPLTITYDYGDGTSDATGQHAYNAPMIASVVAFISDGDNTVTSMLQLPVVSAATPDGDADGDGIPNTIDNDDDGDGLSDAFETAAGSSPTDPNSSPLTNPAQAQNPGGLNALKMAIKLSFTKNGADSITLSGTLPVKAGYTGEGQKVVFDVGGVIRSFTLTAKNTAKTLTDSIKVSVKAKKGVVSADQEAKFSVKFGKDTFSNFFTDEGLTNETVKNKSLTIRVDALFQGQLLRKQMPQVYSAKQGSSGKTK